MTSEIKYGFGVKFAHGIGNLVSQMTYQMFSFLIFTFYWAVVKLDINVITMGYIIWSIWNALNEPLAGYISDRTKSRWGRRIPYIAVSIIPLALIMVFLWTPVSLLPRDLGNFIYFMVIIIAFDGVYTFAFMSHTALFPEMFQDEKERASANLYRQVLLVVGLICGFIIPTLLISDPEAHLVSRTQVIAEYQQAGLIIAIITVIAMIITVKWGCKERPEFMRDAYKVPGFRKAISYSLKNRSFLTYVIVGLMFWTIVSVLPILINLYSRFALGIGAGETIWTGILLGATFVFGAIFVYFWKFIKGRLGTKKTFIISMIVFGITLQPLLFITDRIQGLIVFAIIGLGLAGPMYLIDIVISHIVDEDELKTGVRREGMYYGMNGVMIRFSTVITFIAIAIVFNSTGWHIFGTEAGITPDQLLGLRLLMTVFPAILCAIGVISLLFYPLDEKRLQEIIQAKKELHIKKAEEIKHED
ncbi:MAG: MFS transporter [Candidatus Helarchaeota archaeon]